MTKFTEEVTQLHLSRQFSTHTRSLGRHNVLLTAVELDVLSHLQKHRHDFGGGGRVLEAEVHSHFGGRGCVVERREGVVNSDCLLRLPIDFGHGVERAHLADAITGGQDDTFCSRRAGHLDGVGGSSDGGGDESVGDVRGSGPGRLRSSESDGKGVNSVGEVLTTAGTAPTSEADGAACAEAAEGILAVVRVDLIERKRSRRSRTELGTKDLSELDEDSIGASSGGTNDDLRWATSSGVSALNRSASQRACSPGRGSSFVSESRSIGALVG